MSLTSKRFIAIVLILVAVALGYFDYQQNSNSFKLGLDLNGGTQLVYKADLSKIESADVSDSMSALRDVIERRVNIFGVSEPLVQVEHSSALSTEPEERLLVELPGVTDIDQAVELIGKTPSLEFRIQRRDLPTSSEELAKLNPDEVFVPTGLTGALVERATLQFNSQGVGVSEPVVSLDFNSEGQELFANLTGNNVGQILAIFLDGVPISTPVIREKINQGTAQISGSFTPEEARELVRNLNLGALPVPIELVGTQVVGATLGHDAVNAGMKAGLFGFGLVVLFLILWYRLPGLLASVSLAIYLVIMLALFKLIPVTLTAAAIAGLIMSVGTAVDANVLIFERFKEERKEGKTLKEAVDSGFSRAWSSVRDSNISSFITAIILFWFGTSLIKGFALVLGMGVLVNMLTAIVITKLFLKAVSGENAQSTKNFLFGKGFSS